MRFNAQLLPLPIRDDARGGLVFAEAERHVPFAIRRIYVLFGADYETTRGMHAHRRLAQCLVAVSGSFRVVLSDGHEQRSYDRDHPGKALYIGPMMWRELTEFSPGATCLVLASDYFDESDYIRKWSEFVRETRRVA